MNNIVKTSFILLFSTLALSGCSSLFDLVTNDIDGDGVISQGEASLAAYTQTLAGSGPATGSAAQISGIASYAVGSSTPITSTSASGSFKNATVTMAANQAAITIQVDGQTHVVPRALAASNKVINGQNYTLHTFGDPGAAGNRAGSLNGQYASLTYFFNNVLYSGGGVLQSYDSFAFIPNGLETPDSQMPTQSATYGGIYYLLVGTSQKELSFTATADFAAGIVNGGVGTGADRATYFAHIEGNHFAGTMSALGANAVDGNVIGAFYGPNAEEIAGAVQGTSAGQGAAGYFIGNKN